MKRPTTAALFAAGVAALALGAAACSPKTTDTATAAATPSAAATTQGASEQTAEFVRDAALSDMYEIEASKLALEKSQSAEVKAFAQMMIDAHTATSAALGPMATEAGITPPTALDEAHTNKLNDLRNASAADFDDKYIDQQTEAHEKALGLMRDFANDNTAVASIRGFAAETAPKVQAHLDQAKALDKSPADDPAGANSPSPAPH